MFRGHGHRLRVIATDDLIKKVKMQRLLGQVTAACFQRCVGLDAFNAVYSTTYEIDKACGTTYHENFKKFVQLCQDNDYTVDGAMTDPKGDRSLAPHKQDDPDMFLRVVERREDGTYTGEIKGKNGIWALLDPDKGIVHEFNARFARDNWDMFVLKKTGTDRGYTLRYGVNTRGITWKKSNNQLITRIVPIAKAADGSDLYLPEEWIDSDLIDDYAYIRMERLQVAGQVGKDKGTGDGSTWTEADLLDEMRAKAEEQFSVNHVDQVVHEVTIQIEQLEDTAEYAWLKNLKQLLLYDVVTAVDPRIGLNMQLYVSELEYDFIREKITGIKLTNIQDMNVRTVAGYNMMNNSISPEKLTDEVTQVIVEKAIDIIG